MGALSRPAAIYPEPDCPENASDRIRFIVAVFILPKDPANLKPI